MCEARSQSLANSNSAANSGGLRCSRRQSRSAHGVQTAHVVPRRRLVRVGASVQSDIWSRPRTVHTPDAPSCVAGRRARPWCRSLCTGSQHRSAWRRGAWRYAATRRVTWRRDETLGEADADFLDSRKGEVGRVAQSGEKVAGQLVSLQVPFLGNSVTTMRHCEGPKPIAVGVFSGPPSWNYTA